MQPERELDELLAGPAATETGRDLHAHGGGPYMPTRHRRLRQGPRPRARGAAARRARGRPAALLPPSRVARRCPVVEMEGAERIMLGSNNYLGLTGDERVHAGRRATRCDRYGTGPDRLAPAQRHDRRCTSSSSARSPSGWAPRTRSSSPPATRPTSARSARSSAPGDTVIVDSGDHASILDGCLLSRAKLRPFRHNRLDKLEKMLERAAGRRRRRARRRRRRLLDGGRHRAAAARSSSCASATARG